jgi:hypothetical protein
MNTKIIGGVVVAVAIAGGSFYGGMTYAQSKTPARGQFANAQLNGQLGSTRGTSTGMGGLTSGEIISKDATSITIKMSDGSTKIALISTSTQIMKTAAGTLTDLSAGTSVVVTGSANSDGSVTAQSVQIRPASAPPIGQTRTIQ